MSNQQDEIREAILLRTYKTWADGNPFSDTVDRRVLLDDLEDKIVGDVDANDVKYAWKLMTEGHC